LNLPFFIAKRYLLSKRKKNFINVISILSMSGVAICTAALIIVLSVFNGLEGLLRNLNNAFDPQIKIEASQGKSFPVTNDLTKKISATPGVKIITEVIEDYAYARYRDANQVVTIKGVSENFIQQARIPKDNIVDGKLQLKESNISYAIVGRGISSALSIDVHDGMIPLQLYYIKNVQATSLDPSKLYSQRNILPGGIFSIVQNLDDNYIIVPLNFAQDLLNYGNRRTSLEIKVKEGFETKSVQNNLRKLLGEEFLVLNQDEQHKDLYRLLKMEKLVTFLSLSLLLTIGSINIFFSLMMLAIDKKKDISVLFAIGGNKELIRNIFLAEGALISLIGTVTGLILGGFFIWLQTEFGLVSMGMASSVTESYPVKVAFLDFLYTLGVVTFITFSISIRPAILASKRFSLQSL
jgi:lipoprotein-releasing system permease protein